MIALAIASNEPRSPPGSGVTTTILSSGNPWLLSLLTAPRACSSVSYMRTIGSIIFGLQKLCREVSPGRQLARVTGGHRRFLGDTGGLTDSEVGQRRSSKKLATAK